MLNTKMIMINEPSQLLFMSFSLYNAHIVNIIWCIKNMKEKDRNKEKDKISTPLFLFFC